MPSHGGYYMQNRSGMSPQYPSYPDMGMMYSQQFASQSKPMSENDMMMTMKSQNIAIKPNSVSGMINQSIPMNDYNSMFKLNSISEAPQVKLCRFPQQTKISQATHINNISPTMGPPGLEVRSNSQKLKQISSDSLTNQIRDSKQNIKPQSSK